MSQSNMQSGKKNDAQLPTENTGRATSNLPKRAGSAMLRKFWETTQHTVSHDVEQEKRRENTVVRKSLEWKAPLSMETLEKEDKVRDQIFEPKPLLSRTFKGRIQKPQCKSSQTGTQSSSSNMRGGYRPYSKTYQHPSGLRRQNAFLWSDPLEQESQLMSETTIQKPFGNKVEQDNGGMDMEEKKLSSSMNSKDGSQQLHLPKSLVTRVSAESKSKEGSSNLPVDLWFASQTLAPESGGVKKGSAFVLSKEDFLKYYTLVPIVESVMESGTTKSNDTSPSVTLNNNTLKENTTNFRKIENQEILEELEREGDFEEEELRLLEEIEKELEEERNNEIQQMIDNLYKK